MHRIALFLLASVLSLAAADVSGKWTGTFSPDDGDEGPALLVLQQKGEMLTGTAGPNEEHRMEISNGKVVGDKVTFQVGDGDRVMKFELTIKGEEITGQASRENDGQHQTAKLKVTRAK